MEIVEDTNEVAIEIGRYKLAQLPRFILGLGNDLGVSGRPFREEFVHLSLAIEIEPEQNRRQVAMGFPEGAIGDEQSAIAPGDASDAPGVVPPIEGKAQGIDVIGRGCFDVGRGDFRNGSGEFHRVDGFIVSGSEIMDNVLRRSTEMFTPKGKFGWYELMTSDTKAAGAFYSDVVGWTTQEVSGGGDNQYTTFNIGETGIAGMLHIPGHVAWIGYIAVDDVDAHIEKIVEAGGKLWKPATDVPGMLRFAVVADPQGAAFVVFTPDPAMPSPERPAPPTVGTVGWHELYTTDLESGFAFYNQLFGWTKVGDMDMGAMGTYRIFDEGDHKEMGSGGMMAKAPYIPVSSWTFYFHVDSIGAAIERVKSGGGSITNGPMQVPGGAWIIQGQDPQGGMFSLVSNEE